MTSHLMQASTQQQRKQPSLNVSPPDQTVHGWTLNPKSNFLSFPSWQKTPNNWIFCDGRKKASWRNDDPPRIKEIYSKKNPFSAWFGDVGDGVHDGGPEDPRMKLIEVQSKYITYWKHTTGALGFAKEIAGATLLRQVANTGDLRELGETEIKEARVKDSVLSS